MAQLRAGRAEEFVNAFVAGALAATERVDVLMNNAGVMPLSLIDALRVDDWNQMIDVNLARRAARIAAALPTMRARRSGHIINAPRGERPALSVHREVQTWLYNGNRQPEPPASRLVGTSGRISRQRGRCRRTWVDH